MTDTHIKEDLAKYFNSPIIPELFIKGLPALSQIIGGLRTQQINLFVGETGTGKTDLVVDIALRISEQVPVLFISSEMGREKTIPRFIANKSCFTKRQVEELHRNYLECEDEKHRQGFTQEFQEVMKGQNLYMEYTRQFSEIVASIIKHVEDYQTQFIFIDHILILTCDINGTANERVDFMIEELEKIAKNYNVGINIVTQFNKQNERGIQHGNRVLGEIAGNRCVGQLVENILYLHSTEPQDKKNKADKTQPREVTISSLKVRNGAGGEITYTYNPRKAKFYELPNQAILED